MKYKKEGGVSPMKRKVLMGFLALGLTMSSLSTVSATTLQDSTGSVSTSESTGADLTQGVSTTYGDENISTDTADQSASVDVYASKASYASIRCPRKLILGPDAVGSTNYKCSYKLGVDADLAGNQQLTITVPSTASLVEQNGKPITVTANITLNSTNSWTVTASDLVDGPVSVNGEIIANGLKSGSYKAVTSFGILLEKTTP